MAQNPSATADIVTPKIKVIEAATAAALATAVDVQTNVLNKLMRLPASGQTTGAVVNGSIVVGMAVSIVVNNVATYQCSVMWNQWVTPT